MHVLDIGCGWGEALKFSAKRYDVSGVGVTGGFGRDVFAFAHALLFQAR